MPAPANSTKAAPTAAMNLNPPTAMPRRQRRQTTAAVASELREPLRARRTNENAAAAQLNIEPTPGALLGSDNGAQKSSSGRRRRTVHPLSAAPTSTRPSRSHNDNTTSTPLRKKPLLPNTATAGQWTPSGQVFIGRPTAVERALLVGEEVSLSAMVSSAVSPCVVEENPSANASPSPPTRTVIVDNDNHQADNEVMEDVREHAATCIQSMFRMALQRRSYMAMQVERCSAATTLQAVWRGRQVRRQYAALCKSATTLQAAWRGRQARREYSSLYKATTTLQCTWRRYLAHRRSLRTLGLIYTTQCVRSLFHGRPGHHVDSVDGITTTLNVLPAGVWKQLEQLVESLRAPAATEDATENTAKNATGNAATKNAALVQSLHPHTTTATPSRIPKPAFLAALVSKPRTETPTPRKIVLPAVTAVIPVNEHVAAPVVEKGSETTTIGSRRLSLRVKRRASDESASGGATQGKPSLIKEMTLSSATVITSTTTTATTPAKDDPALIEKMRKLAAIRARKEALQAQLAKETASSSSPAIPTSAPAHIAQPATTTSQHQTVNLILAHLAHLSPTELQRLAAANTRANGKYTRPIEYVVVRKAGPKPESPNAKTLAKFAREAARVAGEPVTVTKGGSGDGKYVKWRNAAELASLKSASSSPRRAMASGVPARSCLKRSLFGADLPATTTTSPIKVQRFIYEAEEVRAVRRLTGINARASSTATTPKSNASTSSKSSTGTTGAKRLSATPSSSKAGAAVSKARRTANAPSV